MKEYFKEELDMFAAALRTIEALNPTDVKRAGAGKIPKRTADRIRARWDAHFSGAWFNEQRKRRRRS